MWEPSRPSSPRLVWSDEWSEYMTLSYDYPLLGFFWSVLMVFIWIAWIVLVIRIFSDIARNPDMGGVAKALWALFVILAPFLGAFIYLIVHGAEMTKRY